jgi:hypothetical protein
MRYRIVGTLAVAALLAACGTDEPTEGDTQIVPPPEPPGMQQPHYPEPPPVQDTVVGPMSPDQATGGAPHGRQ